jgi:hypothetical protein
MSASHFDNLLFGRREFARREVSNTRAIFEIPPRLKLSFQLICLTRVFRSLWTFGNGTDHQWRTKIMPEKQKSGGWLRVKSSTSANPNSASLAINRCFEKHLQAKVVR